MKLIVLPARWRRGSGSSYKSKNESNERNGNDESNSRGMKRPLP